MHDPGRDDHDPDLELDYAAVPAGGPLPGHEASSGEPVDVEDCPPLDEERDQVGYELFDWDPHELDELDDALHEMGLPHEWLSDGYEVVVHVEDEAAIDALLPTIRFPDELPAEPDDGDDTDATVLSALFVAADKLVSNPTGEAVTEFLDAAELVGDDVPWGVDEAQWDLTLEQVDALLDLFHLAGPIDQIRTTATRLRDRLRPLV